jgi:hypothetical protein
MKTHSQISLLFAGLSLAVGTLALTGCSSDDNRETTVASYSCSTKGPCAGDPVPSNEEVAACEDLTSDPTCGSAFQAYASCAYAAARCSDSSLSDPDADSASAACVSQYAVYTTCLGTKNVDGGAASP